MAQSAFPSDDQVFPPSSEINARWDVFARLVRTLADQPDADPAALVLQVLVPDLAFVAAVFTHSDHIHHALASDSTYDLVEAAALLAAAQPPVVHAPLHSRGQAFGTLRVLPRRTISLDMLTVLADMLAFALAARPVAVPPKPPASPVPDLIDYRAAFESIYRNTNIGIAFGGGWSIIAANQAFQDLIGYTEAELQQISIAKLTPPDELAREMELAQGLIDGTSQHYVIEKHYYHKAGHLVPIRLTGTAVPVADESALLGLVLVEDLTARRRAEMALRDSEARYRLLIEQQTELVVCWRYSDGARTFVNDAYCRFFGRFREELLGTPIYDVIHPADLMRVRGEIAQQIRADTIRIGTNRVVRSDGSVAWCEWSSLMISAVDGHPDEIQSVGRDVTARYQAEELRDWLVAILEASPAVVHIVDLEGRLRYMNRAARTLRGLPYDAAPEALSTTIFQPHWVMHLLRTHAIPVALQTGIWHGETAFLNAEGDTVPYWQTLVALHDGDHRVARMATIAYDLSDQKRAAANQLAIERKMLEAQKLESLGVLAGGIAHDFNNILAAIVGHAELALYSIPLASESHQSMQAVIIHAQRAADLTRQILTYAGKSHVVPSSIDLTHLLREVATLLAAAALRHCRLMFDLDRQVPQVSGDQSQLRQAILNVLMNSAEAVDDGGLVHLRVWSEYLDRPMLDKLLLGADLQPRLYVALEVYDEGGGIAPEVLSRIFDPFFSTKFVGRGMGLAAVQGIVRSHRGAINVHSTLGKGTSFTIWLPAETNPEQIAG